MNKGEIRSGLQALSSLLKKSLKICKKSYVLRVFLVCIVLMLLPGCREYEDYVLKRSEELHRSTAFGVEPVAEGEMTEETMIKEDEKDIYVTIPVESLYLRSSASQDGEVIEELSAGRYLKRDSLDPYDLEGGYYKVKVMDSGKEGYVPASFCTPVFWIFEGVSNPVVYPESKLYSYDEMVLDIEELCSLYKECLSYEIVGKSVDERDIYELHLGNPKAEKRIFIDASIHGREYITTQLTMMLVEYYASQYDKGCFHNLSYSDLFDGVCFDILPMINPDGVTISQYGEEGLRNETLRGKLREIYEYDKDFLVYQKDGNGSMYWSDYYRTENFDKSSLSEEFQKEIDYEDYLTMWKSNAHGVDINNNFDVAWEESDYKTYSSYGASKGKTPGSEPETGILMNESKEHDYSCYINYHSRGQIIYYDTYGMGSRELKKSLGLAEELSDIIKYPPISTFTDGSDKAGFGDYVHNVLKKPGVTIEVGKEPSPVPVSELKGIFARNRESWAMLAFLYS